MRLTLPNVLTALALLIVISPKLFAQNTSSYGPEISAEDFAQHVARLSTLSTTAARENYIAQQLIRLGLNSRQVVCENSEQGIYAELKSIQDSEATTQYMAQLEDVYQIASVLEITERFITQKPRPSHDVRFSFIVTSQDKLVDCSNLNMAKINIQPIGMEKLDSRSLVRELNALYLEGK